MSSPDQIAANRANAQLSTGPRTEAGKSRAAQNARKHGLTSAHLIILDSDGDAFESMREALTLELAPQGELESTMFDRILHSNWNIRRIRILEAGLLEEKDGAADPMTLEQNEAKFLQLDRHARRHDSNLHRAIKELRVLQTERAFRSLALAATQNEPKAAAPSPLVNTQAARQAHLRERAAKSRLDGVELGRLLDRLIDTPPHSEELGTLRL